MDREEGAGVVARRQGLETVMRGAAAMLLAALLLLAPAGRAVAQTPPEVLYSALSDGSLALDDGPWRLAHVPTGFLPTLEADHPKVMLALSGGGARGLAHIGVIEVFEEEGIPIDGIVGTSMGAIVGGLYASGYSARDLQLITERLEWSSLFSDAPARRNLFLAQKQTANEELLSIRFRNGQPYVPDALVSGESLFLEIQRLIYDAPLVPTGGSFLDLKVPFGVVATDLNKGRRVLFTRGDLPLTLRGTMAVPILFRALRLNGMLLVDGGALENIPTHSALEMGADRVIAVDCASPREPELDPDLPWEIANQVTTLMSAANDSIARAHADFVLTPELAGVGNTSFDDVRTIIERGRAAARKALPRLRELLPEAPPAPKVMVQLSAVTLSMNATLRHPLRPEEFGLVPGRYSTQELNTRLGELLRELRLRDYPAASLNTRLDRDGVLRINIDLGLIHRIHVGGVPETLVPVVMRDVYLQPGEPLRGKDLRHTLIRLHATGRFTTAYSRLERDGWDGVDVHILVEEAPHPRVGLGLGFDTDRRSRYLGEVVFGGTSVLQFIDEIVMRARYGEQDRHYRGHIRADRLGTTYMGWLAALEYRERDQELFDPFGEEIRETRIYTARAELNALFNLSTWGRLSAGVVAERVMDDLAGDDRRTIYNGIDMRATLDTEDRRPFPRSGTRVDIGYASYVPSGVQENFNIFDLYLEGVVPLDSRLVARSAFQGGVAELTTPLTHRFRIGGLTEFPALRPDRFIALRTLQGTLELRYDLISRIIADAYVLARYDLAAFSDQKNWRPTRHDLIQSIALGFALDTLLGPLEIWGAYMPESATADEQFRVAVNLGYRF